MASISRTLLISVGRKKFKKKMHFVTIRVCRTTTVGNLALLPTASKNQLLLRGKLCLTLMKVSLNINVWAFHIWL